MTFTLGLVIAMELCAGLILRIFSNDVVYVSQGAVALRIIFLVIPFAGYQMLASGVFQALGKSMQALFLAIVRQVVLTPLVLYLPTFGDLGILGVWVASPIADIIAGSFTYILMKREVTSLTKVALT